MGGVRVRSGFWIIAVLVAAADQWTKSLVQAQLPLNVHRQPLIPGFLYLTHVHNPGVAFGQFANAGVLLILAAFAAVLAIILYRRKLILEHGDLHPVLVFGLALPLGGAVGNVIDRIRLGKVVDFLDLLWWPVFNVADSAITVGAALLMIYFFFLNQPHAQVQEEEVKVAG